MNTSQLYGRNPDSQITYPSLWHRATVKQRRGGLPIIPPREMKGVSTTVSGRKKNSFLDYNEKAVHPVLKLDVKRKGNSH